MKLFLNDLSIRRKVVVTILAATMSTLLIGAAALIGYELATYRSVAHRELASMANIVGASAVGAIVFEDEQAATDILARLGEDASILTARLFTEEGRPLATYLKAGFSTEDVPAAPRAAGHVFQQGRLTLDHPISHRNDLVGHLHVTYDLARFKARLKGYVGIVLAAMAVLVGFSFVISSALQQFVSGPILELAAVARRITEQKDYFVRARPGGQDEIGTLTRAFNQMLQAIQVREMELDASRQSMQLAQAAGRIGTFDWYADTQRAVWSVEMEAIYGMPEGSFDGTHEAWWNRIHPDDRDRVEETNKAAVESGELNTEFRIIMPDGSVRWVVSRARYIKNEAGKLSRVVGVNIDITDRKAAETRLIEQAEELWRSNRELEQFAYVSSHDLQEPLRKVANYAQLIGSKYKGKLGEEADRYIENVTDGVSRMRDLIHDLLAYSRLSRQFPPPEAVDLNAIVKRVVEDLEPTIAESRAVIEAEPLPTIQARPSQMHQLFQNLVSNALKFRGDKPPVVRLTAKRQGDSHVFSVKDNGIGLETKYAAQIFKVFQRLHPRGRYPGTGIGLAICKKIVEQHGGKIWVESDLGNGAEFLFSVPLVVKSADQSGIDADVESLETESAKTTTA